MSESENGVEIRYLGWDKPLVRAVADDLIAHCPEMNWADLHLVLSSGRAGRRLISVLADEASEREVAMLPPTIVTLGQLPELLYSRPEPAAETFLRQMAWVTALRKTPYELLKPLFPKLTQGASLSMHQGAAHALERCAEELASAGTDFAAVVAMAAQNNVIREPERWKVAERIYSSYLQELEAMGVCDRQKARADAARSLVAGWSASKIILAGVTELSRQSRALLGRLPAGTVEALVFAPEELAAGFDAYGCVASDYWERCHVDLKSTKLSVAQGIADQARAVFVSIAEAAANLQTDEVTIGVADEEIVPYLETIAENLPDVPVRFGGGTELGKTRPFQLLSLVAQYLETQDFKDFCALVRHPDLEKWLGSDEAQGDSANRVWRDWRSLLDDYAGQFLPRRLGPGQCDPAGWRGEPATEKQTDNRPDLAWLYRNVERFLGDLKPAKNNQRENEPTKTPDEWAPGILSVLRRAYGGRWDQNDPAKRRVVMSCLAMLAIIEQLVEAGESARNARFENVPVHEAVQLVVSLAAGQRIPPPMTGAEIEIVGWLELMPDDAPHLVVSGFNEGRIPESTLPSPLINELIRELMNLPRDRDRLARDAYLLTAMVESRKQSGGSVTLITGRRSGTNDPLLPSRLMFRCEPNMLASRVLEAVEPAKNGLALALRFSPGLVSKFPIGAAGCGKDAKITSMSVTGFRDYLRSPQGFYLKNVLRLDTLEDGAPREMDARQCGDVVHAVMNGFATTPAARSDSRNHCIDTLLELLDEQIARRFGASIPGTLKFQVEMIRRRLEKLGEEQAKWFAEGWKIVASEWAPKGAAGLAVDGTDMGLRGRIDRVDFNERINTFAVLDYKVGAGRKPEETHRKAGRWCDLQLPLYRHLARDLISTGGAQVQLGYMVIAEDPEKTGPLIASWDSALLASADEAARQVVRDVRECKFDNIGDDPPTDGIFAHIFGEGILSIGGDERLADEEAGL